MAHDTADQDTVEDFIYLNERGRPKRVITRDAIWTYRWISSQKMWVTDREIGTYIRSQLFLSAMSKTRADLYRIATGCKH